MIETAPLDTHSETPATSVSPIVGTGVMAERVRDFDWSTTALGPIHSWSYTLRTHVNLVLCSPHPAALYWGSTLTSIYNDATIKVLGPRKDRAALGRSFRDVRREAWPQIGPDVDACLRFGIAVERKTVPLKGFSSDRQQQHFYDYFLIPIHDQGVVVGIHGSFLDVTEETLKESKRATELATMEALFAQAPVTIALLSGPDHVFEMVNQAHQDMIGGRAVVGLRVADAVPEAVEQGFVARLDEVYRTGIPYRANNARFLLRDNSASSVRTLYLDFVYQPRREMDGTICGIISLGVDVTERVRAEQARLHTEKLAAVGHLATSIAHEINNPLTSVLNFLFLASLTSDLEEIRGYLDIIEIELRRIAQVSHQALATQRAVPALIDDRTGER